MLEGVRIALEIASQPALKALEREPLSVPLGLRGRTSRW